MKAVLLCAGLGTRLRPLTERWPKPAVPVLGVPLLRYTLSLLRQAGVTAVGINTHHLPEVMEATAREECARLRLGLEVCREAAIQGTGGGIRSFRSFVGGEPFVVWNADILFALDVARVVEAHRAAKSAATMVLMPMPKHEKYAGVETDAQSHVRRIAGLGPGGERLSVWHFASVHVIDPVVFEHMSPSGEEDINRQIYPRVMGAGLSIRGQVVQGYWSDLGTPSRYLATVQDLLAGQVPAAPFGDAFPLKGASAGGIFKVIDPSARVEGAVTGPAYFDRGCVVEAGAKIGGGVYLGPGAVVKSGARINRAVVLEETVIGSGEELVETIAFGPQRVAAPL